MLNLIHALSGRPWAVRSELAAHVHGLMAKEGLAGLRHLAELRSGVRAHDDDIESPRAASRRSQMATSSTVAVIPILGVVTQRGGMDAVTCEGFRSTDDIAAEVQAAAADPKVDATLLEVDSPGGEVFGVPEAWAVIREAARQKPIVVSVNSVSASAAYYLSSAATEIWVNPSGQVGSIGVYCLHVDISKYLEAEGEKWTFISAGKYKVEGNHLEPLGDEARAAIQADIDRYYDMFTRDVAKGRGVNVKRVTGGFGEGRMVGAAQAVEMGMADKVGTFDQAIRRAAQLGADARKSGGKAAEMLPAAPAMEEREAPTTPASLAAPTSEQRSALAALRGL